MLMPGMMLNKKPLPDPYTHAVCNRFAAYRPQPVYYFLLIALIAISCLPGYTQPLRRCGAQQQDSLLKARNPAYARARAHLQELLSQPTAGNRKKAAQAEVTLIIPVVVHVIHNTPSGEMGGSENANITDRQIFSQLDVLNEDYQRKANTNGFNTHPAGANVNIEFRLANLDPQGRRSTGITRTYSTKTSYATYEVDKLANLAYWPSDQYLNIWVTRITGEFIGYAQFPDASNEPGLAEYNGLEKTDGVVIDFQNFGREGTASRGPYNLGRTTTHEVGHWLGLLHTWGDEDCGNDYCPDTPPAFGPNETLTCDQTTSRCSGVSTRNMIENYLDYSPDRCMNIFTQDQKDRIRRVLELSPRRKKLIESVGELLPEREALEVTVEKNPAFELLELQVLLKGAQPIHIEVADAMGKVVFEKNIASTRSGEFPIDITSLRQGMYFVRVRTPTESQVKRVLVL